MDTFAFQTSFSMHRGASNYRILQIKDKNWKSVVRLPFCIRCFSEGNKKKGLSIILLHSVCYGKQRSFHTALNHTVRAFFEASTSFDIKILLNLTQLKMKFWISVERFKQTNKTQLCIPVGIVIHSVSISTTLRCILQCMQTY